MPYDDRCHTMIERCRSQVCSPIKPKQKTNQQQTKTSRVEVVLPFEAFKESPQAREDHFVLFGNPVRHSLSPLIHSMALGYAGIEATYTAVELRLEEVTAAIAWMHGNEHFRGANVTIPYKQSFTAFVDECGEEVLKTGALNTIRREAGTGRLSAVNTDVEGFLAPLDRYMGEIVESPAVVFGSGGAARAVLFALMDAGVEEIVMVSRRPDDARDQFRGDFDVDSGGVRFAGYEQWTAFAEEAFLMVNATPAGMKGFPVACPVGERELAWVCEAFGPKLLYDLVYTPYDTPFLIAGQEVGAFTCHGVEMFLHQAAASFRYWTGCEFPIGLCRGELERRLHVG